MPEKIEFSGGPDSMAGKMRLLFIAVLIAFLAVPFANAEPYTGEAFIYHKSLEHCMQLVDADYKKQFEDIKPALKRCKKRKNSWEIKSCERFYLYEWQESLIETYNVCREYYRK